MRKSKELRLAQAKEILELYSVAGLAQMKEARFLTDMIRKLEAGRYPTKRQRAWIDQIIEAGLPEPLGDEDYIAKIDAALATEGIDCANVLTDFRYKCFRGWKLSDKQKAWCDSLIKKAEDIRAGNYWRPDEEMTERIKLAVSVKQCYNSTYWNTHGGGRAAMEKAEAWVAGHLKIIDEWTVNKLFKTVTGKLREMENPRFQHGELGYISMFDKEFKQHVRVPGIIVGGPTPTRLGIGYDILINGEIINSTAISKRR